MKKNIILLFLTGFIFSSVNAQELNLNDFLAKAETASKQYVELFKDLVADESKTVKTFKKDGSIDNERHIKSHFIVYQTENLIISETEKEKRSSEFRTVYEYNGKNVSRSDEDVVKFFEKLTKADNAQEELKKIKKESQRFDGNFLVWGVTLYQDFFLRSEIRKIFAYKLLEQTQIDNHEVYVIEFRQKEYSPFVLSNPTKEEAKNSTKGFSFNTEISSALQPTNPRMNGKLWLDSKTAQVWKIEYEVVIQPANFTKPLLITSSLYEYQTSKFGILTPKRLIISNNRIFGKKPQEVESKLLATTILEYSNFENLSSNVKDYKVGDDKK